MSTDIIHSLTKLENELKKISQVEEEEINFFTAVGMAKQEVKHSFFFAWLLDPKNPHRFKEDGISVLYKFFERLYDYVPKNYGKKEDKDNIETNEKILASTVHSKSELLSFLQSKVEVNTEQVIVNAESRIDILIDLPDTKTVVVIENKVDTQSHDNQLCRYQEEINNVNSKFKDYIRKIFVYLSPQGEVPKNNGLGGDGKYNKNYCIFDYREICKIVEEIKKELSNKKSNTKIKYILEDYLDMCKTNIFHENPEAFEICRRIMADDELRSAYETLVNYNNTPVESKVLEYCCRDILNDQNAEGRRMFYTPVMKNYFLKHGETFTGNECRIVCQPEYDGANRDGNQKLKGYVIFAQLTTESTKHWTPAQDKLVEKLNKTKSGKYARIITKVHLLSASECREQWDKVEPLLPERLKKFKEKLAELENIMNIL